MKAIDIHYGLFVYINIHIWAANPSRYMLY